MINELLANIGCLLHAKLCRVRLAPGLFSVRVFLHRKKIEQERRVNSGVTITVGMVLVVACLITTQVKGHGTFEVSFLIEDFPFVFENRSRLSQRFLVPCSGEAAQFSQNSQSKLEPLCGQQVDVLVSAKRIFLSKLAPLWIVLYSRLGPTVAEQLARIAKALSTFQFFNKIKHVISGCGFIRAGNYVLGSFLGFNVAFR